MSGPHLASFGAEPAVFKTGDIITWQGPEMARLSSIGDGYNIVSGEKFIVKTIVQVSIDHYRWRGYARILRTSGSLTYIYDNEYHHCSVTN